MITRGVQVAIAAVGIALGVIGFRLLRENLGVPEWEALASVGVAWTFLAAGLVAWVRRPATRVGVLMAGVGLALLWRKLQYSDDSRVFVAGFLGGELNLALSAHAILAYPTGRIRAAFDRRFLAVGYAIVLVAPLVTLLFHDPPRTCLFNCGERDQAFAGPENPLLVRSDPAVFDALRDGFYVLVYGVMGSIFIGLIVRRLVSATRLERHIVGPLLVAGFAAATRAVSESFFNFVEYSARTGTIVYVWQVVAQAAVPLALLAGLHVARLDRAAIADLVRDLDDGATPARVRDALARALRDPALEIFYWVPERGEFVDARGRPVDVDSARDGRSVLRLEHEGEPLAALVHDPALAENPELLDAAGAAARLALENARLHAEVQAQLLRVHESRRRIVSAGDEQRRRIERDLHDGAQQRLVALALALRTAQRRADAGDATDGVLERAVAELQAAVAELRELARGVHPAVLTEEGLAAALQSLADRTPVRVNVDAATERFAPEIEAAAYYVACEALTNAVKHAQASEITISAERRNGALVVAVVDDGVGGADAERGSGLRGLADRVEAFGGRLRVDSRPGRGTRVVGELPCES